jgi:protein tyrosine phosphatase (PTP) superfamily phosphohydrolase (DUF442 family)
MQSFMKRLSPAALLLFSCVVVAHAADYYPELPRFQQVSERLYRGAQPRKGGIPRLAGLGINTIVNLRGAGAHTRADEAEAKSLGLNYFNIPLPIWGRPSDGAVRRVMEIVTSPDNGRVFVHCKDGVDRSGMIVALHRITAEGWSTAGATAEAVRLGMRRYQYWMRDYISDYSVRHRQTTAVNDDMKDRIGIGIRVGERVTFKARKTAVQMLRRAPGFLGKVF